MAIYTKVGDKGMTSLLSGTKVPKHHMRLEAYGTIDELNTHIGLLRSQDVDETSRAELIAIQDSLFTMASHLAVDNTEIEFSLPEFREDATNDLEKAIDAMDKDLPELKHFIHPGGNNPVSYCHIARTVCRRAERRVVQLNEKTEIPEKFVIYLNRLSDYLFVLARKLSFYSNAEEIPWKPQR